MRGKILAVMIGFLLVPGVTSALIISDYNSPSSIMPGIAPAGLEGAELSLASSNYFTDVASIQARIKEDTLLQNIMGELNDKLRTDISRDTRLQALIVGIALADQRNNLRLSDQMKSELKSKAGIVDQAAFEQQIKTDYGDDVLKEIKDGNIPAVLIGLANDELATLRSALEQQPDRFTDEEKDLIENSLSGEDYIL